MMNKQHRWTRGRILNGVLALMVMAMIFLFSAGNGESSSSLSRTVTSFLIRLIYPEYSSMEWARRMGAFDMLHLLVRKAAHFAEFALLGAALRQFLWTFPLKCPTLLAWLGATAYAALDELHQLYVDGRSGQLRDILIDSAGALFGAFLAAAVTAMVLEYLRDRKHRNGSGKGSQKSA